MPRWLRLRGPGLQIAHLLRKGLGRRVRIRIERARGAHVAARRAADAEVDAARRERLQHAELLGHLQRAVVRQHHAGAADADAFGARRDRGHQDLGRAADDRRQAVVLAEPEARVAEALAVLREVERVADRGVLAAAGERDRLVEHRESKVGHAFSRADGSGRSSAPTPAARPARCRGSPRPPRRRCGPARIRASRSGWR